MEIAYLNFKQSIKSPETFEYYDGTLTRFKDYCHCESYDSLLFNKDRKTIEAKIAEWVIDRKEKGTKASTLTGYLAALWHFYDINDVTDINWRRMRAFLPEKSKVHKDRPYTTEELRKILDRADGRLRVAILLMASSGLRIGAITGIRIRDLERIQSFYKITVYAGTFSEYVTFCTPECALAIDDYLKFRETAGETLRPDAPLIREQIAIPDKPRPVSTETLQTIIRKYILSSGLRTAGKMYTRHEVKANHGMRKFFKQQLRRAKVDPIIIERLLGHAGGDKELGVTKLMLTYDPEDISEMAQAYISAADYLTINTENKLRSELAVANNKLALAADLDSRFNEVNAAYQRTQEMVAKMEEKLNSRKYP